MVKVLLENLAQIQNILSDYKHDLFLPPRTAALLRKTPDAFLMYYTRLGNACDAKGRLLFNAVPKLHWLWHMAARSRYLNPRRAATFIDEDFVKQLKRICAKCVAGTQQHFVPRRLMLKYRWGVGLQ